MIDQLPAHGAPYAGGYFGGIVRINDALHAIAWAPKAEGETKGAWLPSYTDVPGAASCFDSMANTVAMAEAGSAIANWARGLTIGGHTDWCVPARDVLELAYRHLKPGDQENAESFRDGDNPSSVPAGYPYTEQTPAQTEVAAFRDGGDQAFDQAWYWASTQYSGDYAWYQYFYYGFQDSYVKKSEARVRAVRLIPLGT